MKFTSNLSNAVLSPDMNHPNFFKKKTVHTANIRRLNSKTVYEPLTIFEIEQRKKWAARQINILANMRSTAVLGVSANAD